MSKECAKGNIPFPKSMYDKDIFHIITNIGWASHFAQLSFMSPIPPLVIISGDLLVRGAFSNGPINELHPQERDRY